MSLKVGYSVGKQLTDSWLNTMMMMIIINEIFVMRFQKQTLQWPQKRMMMIMIIIIIIIITIIITIIIIWNCLT